MGLIAYWRAEGLYSTKSSGNASGSWTYEIEAEYYLNGGKYYYHMEMYDVDYNDEIVLRLENLDSGVMYSVYPDTNNNSAWQAQSGNVTISSGRYKIYGEQLVASGYNWGIRNVKLYELSSFGRYDAIIHGLPILSQGKIGLCYDLNGTDQSVEVPNIIHAERFTLSAWIKTPNENTQSIASRYDDNGADERAYLFGVDNGGVIRYTVDATGSYSSQNTFYGNMYVADDNWHHCAVSYDGTSMKIFVDGQLDSQQTFTDGVYDANASLEIGAFSNNEDWHFGGQIDDVRIYDHALSQREIRDLSLAPAVQEAINEELNNDVITVYDAPTILGDTSIAFWVYPTTTNRQTIWNNGYDGEGTINFESTSQQLRLYWGDSGGNSGGYEQIDTNTALPLDQWSHAVVIRDMQSQEMKWYVNGELDSSETFNSTSVGETGFDLQIGTGYTGDFTGSLKEVLQFSTVLTQDQVTELYRQRASIDSVGNLHVQKLNDSVVETFADGSFDDEWSTPNFFIHDDVSYFGQYSAGSNNQGSIDAVWSPKELVGGKRITFFEYYWYETSSQSGHAVGLVDSNNNDVMVSLSDNPQWRLADSGGNTGIYNGDGYYRWIYFRFDFNWDNGTYDYYLEDTLSGTVRTGTRNLFNSVDVEKVEFRAASESANYNRFDGLRVGTEQIASENGSVFSGVSETGVSRGLVAWYPLIGDTKDYAGTNHATNNGAMATAEGYEFDGVDDQLEVQDLGFGSGNWTVSSLYKPLGTSSYGHILTSKSSQNNFTCKITPDLQPYFYAGSSFRTDGSNATALTLNEFSLVTYVFDGTSVSVYVNGVLAVSETVTPHNIPSGAFIIQGGNGEYVSAVHRDLRIHNVALTPEEVAIQSKLALDQNGKMKLNNEGTVYTQGQIKEVIA